MRLARSTSWQMRWDVPEELQFSAYVGQQEGFDPSPDASPRTPVEEGWRKWWETLPTRTFGVHFEQVMREMPATSPDGGQARLREAARRAQLDFSPPGFPELAHSPGLQERCWHHWLAFQPAWSTVGGEKWMLTSRMDEQVRRVRPDWIVRRCTRAARKSASRPFSLHVDFVRWPKDFRRSISESHLVLGAQYLDTTRADSLSTLLSEAVARLV